jgi:hypothetical protein
MMHYILAHLQIPIEVTDAGLFVIMETDVRMMYRRLPDVDLFRCNSEEEEMSIT